MPYTLDPLDLLLSKLQIVELNEKDADDCLRLLVTLPARATPTSPATIDLRVFRSLVGDDWGWWRTVTLNLDRITALLDGGARPAIEGGTARSPVPSCATLSAGRPGRRRRAGAGRCARGSANASAGTSCPKRPRTTTKAMRAREHGITIGQGVPGPANAITDVAGVRVGHATLIEGEGPLGDRARPGSHRRDGDPAPGPDLGPAAVRGLPSPERQRRADRTGVGARVGPADHADRAHQHPQRRRGSRRADRPRGPPARPQEGFFWSLPVVGETWDGMLNDINGFHVAAEHVDQALARRLRRSGRRGRRGQWDRDDLP